MEARKVAAHYFRSPCNSGPDRSPNVVSLRQHCRIFGDWIRQRAFAIDLLINARGNESLYVALPLKLGACASDADIPRPMYPRSQEHHSGQLAVSP